MNTIDELLKSLGFDEPIADDEDATTSESTIINKSEVKSYIKDENETAEDFVQRLPPSRTLLCGHADYIAVNSIRNNEGLERFVAKGKKLLKRYKDKYVNNESPDPHPLLGNVLLEKLTLMALEENFLESRFKFDLPMTMVDNGWLKIVRSTMAGELGINAKIDRKTSKYQIRVYMNDFTNNLDETRVYKCLNNLKLGDYQIEYKGSFLSKLGIGEGNQFNIAPGIYFRTDSFQMQDDDMGPLLGVRALHESPDGFLTRFLPTLVFRSKIGFLAVFPEKNKDPRCRIKTVGTLLLEAYKRRITLTPVFRRYFISKEIQDKLRQLALEYNYVKGRWIVNVTKNVNSLWLKTIKGTIRGSLGTNALVRKCYNDYEITVITKDFNDEADVMRILAEMKEFDFEASSFYYQTELYYTLNIKHNNDLGLKPFLYEESCGTQVSPLFG